MQPCCTMADRFGGREAPFEVPVQGREGPVLRARAIACVHGAEVDQITVPGEIGCITDLMLPETPLPDCLFTPCDLGWRAVRWHWHVP